MFVCKQQKEKKEREKEKGNHCTARGKKKKKKSTEVNGRSERRGKNGSKTTNEIQSLFHRSSEYLFCIKTKIIYMKMKKQTNPMANTFQALCVYVFYSAHILPVFLFLLYFVYLFIYFFFSRCLLPPAMLLQHEQDLIKCTCRYASHKHCALKCFTVLVVQI